MSGLLRKMVAQAAEFSDGPLTQLAAAVAAVFVVAVLATIPEHRNPHVSAHRRSAWWRRTPH